VLNGYLTGSECCINENGKLRGKQRMLFRILADIVVVLHLFWILFLIAGAYWGRNRRGVMVVHGAGLLFAIVSQVLGWYCPLTHLEAWLMNKQHAAPAYPGSFIAHYAQKLVYIDVPPSAIFAATLILVAVNGWLYRKALRSRKGFEP
jgi:hypothetical protein